GAAEILLPEVGVIGELVGVGNISAGLDNIGEVRSRHLQTGLDIFADLLQLRAHVAFADDVAALVARSLRAADDPVTAVAQRHQRRRRGSSAGRSENYRLR